jgi:hypothetical protein
MTKEEVANFFGAANPRRPRPTLRAIRIKGRWQLSVEIGANVMDFEWLVNHADTWTEEELLDCGFEIAAER